MEHTRLKAGQPLPSITVPSLAGGELTLGKPKEGCDWQVIVVFRGKHCPLCASYLKEWSEAFDSMSEAALDLIAVSADSQARLEPKMQDLNLKFPVCYDLSVPDMRDLGLYISSPRNENEGERLFAEPALFVVNSEGSLRVADVSNVPFARPTVATLVDGLKFIKAPENNYPIRGTF